MKAIHVFVRVPPRIVQRIKAALRAENAERRERGLEPILLFGNPPSISLPQWFTRAGEREAELTERGEAKGAMADEDLRGPAVNVNFDVSPDLARRCLAALKALNEALPEADRVCLRAGKPSLPRWFLRAGLRELQRQEGALRLDAPRVSCVAVARPTKSRPLYAQTIGRETRPDETASRASLVCEILRRGPATVAEIAEAAGVDRGQASNTISSLRTDGRVLVHGHRETSRTGRPKTTVYALVPTKQVTA